MSRIAYLFAIGFSILIIGAVITAHYRRKPTILPSNVACIGGTQYVEAQSDDGKALKCEEGE